MTELKPCGHCGGNTLAFCEDLYKVNESGSDHWVYLRCLRCGAMMQGHGSTKEAAKDNARCRWNTRAERTCTYTWCNFGDPDDPMGCYEAWNCSNCGEINEDLEEAPCYCLNCGAKVVE